MPERLRESSATTSPLRAIGDEVWIPHAQLVAVVETCPDCLGSARWRVSLPNGEEFDVECCRCYHGGFEPSTGSVVERHEVKGFAELATINRIEMRDGEVEYGTDKGCGFKECDLFDDEASALERSIVKTKEWIEAEDKRKTEFARRKGRARKTANGNRAANDMDFGGGSANYARSQVRDAIKEAFRWIDYAARKGTVIDFDEMKAAWIAQQGGRRG